jgi:hypothetical protein
MAQIPPPPAPSNKVLTSSATVGGISYQYVYDPATGAWSIVNMTPDSAVPQKQTVSRTDTIQIVPQK